MAAFISVKQDYPKGSYPTKCLHDGEIFSFGGCLHGNQLPWRLMRFNVY